VRKEQRHSEEKRRGPPLFLSWCSAKCDSVAKSETYTTSSQRNSEFSSSNAWHDLKGLKVWLEGMTVSCPLLAFAVPRHESLVTSLDHKIVNHCHVVFTVQFVGEGFSLSMSLVDLRLVGLDP
jgi:hypothetical protein